jgi:hypothetical protein
MKTLSLIFLICLVTSCHNSPGSQYVLPPMRTATDDLQVYDGKWHKHLLDNGLTITCSVVNKSDTINYKDVKLEVKYYSKTHTVMTASNYVVYKYLNSGQLIKVNLKGINYQDLDNLSVNVVDATRY